MRSFSESEISIFPATPPPNSIKWSKGYNNIVEKSDKNIDEQVCDKIFNIMYIWAFLYIGMFTVELFHVYFVCHWILFGALLADILIITEPPHMVMSSPQLKMCAYIQYNFYVYITKSFQSFVYNRIKVHCGFWFTKKYFFVSGFKEVVTRNHIGY